MKNCNEKNLFEKEFTLGSMLSFEEKKVSKTINNIRLKDKNKMKNTESEYTKKN